jgi:hypothetical protein
LAFTVGIKRLSQIVKYAGIHAFTKDDFYLVCSGVTQDPARLVLVGGQAIEVWGVLLDVPAPTGDQNSLTEDTDWLGSAADAQWLANYLQCDNVIELTKATLADNTANTAVLLLQRPDGRILLMDFLHSITGLGHAAINKMAVLLELPNQHGKLLSLRVLHPLHCLQSRMANLQIYSKKRACNGLLQAQWALDIVRAYLQQTAMHNSSDEVTKACRELAKISASDSAQYCYTHYGIEPFQAVTPDVLVAAGDKFVQLEWPHMLKRLEVKQARWRNQQVRLQQRKLHSNPSDRS